jgi:hypothetical protein
MRFFVPRANSVRRRRKLTSRGWRQSEELGAERLDTGLSSPRHEQVIHNDRQGQLCRIRLTELSGAARGAAYMFDPGI